ncbi:MAG: gephyrin-like molybdotransferase Glp [Rhizobiaceae bacterium]
MSGLLSVADALAQILDGVDKSSSEQVELSQAAGRILSRQIAANRTQPPFSASAMDGYAVRADDIQKVPRSLNMIGESAAGHGFDGSIDAGECARIFTGAPVPQGADTIVIQENVDANRNVITIKQSESAGRYVRPAGLDFTKGETLLPSFHQLNANTLSLAAAMNHPTLPVQRKPRVAIISSGDELLRPGSEPGPSQIIASNSFGVAEIVRQAGGEPIDLGIAADTLVALEEKFTQASDADIVVTLGGASVGEHDLVREALETRGVELNFWKLAMRPGKPVMFGKATVDDRPIRYVGLPGNPVSSLVCALVFIVPLIRKHLGLDPTTPRLDATLGVDLPKNDQREEYMRASFEMVDGKPVVIPFKSQDSSMLSLMAKAQCLLIRPAHAPALPKGEACEIIQL